MLMLMPMLMMLALALLVLHDAFEAVAYATAYVVANDLDAEIEMLNFARHLVGAYVVLLLLLVMILILMML